MVSGAGLKLIHTGDLGYSRDLRDIGERLDPFDLVLIPIGAYAPRWFMKAMHLDVAEALRREAGLTEEEFGMMRIGETRAILPAR